MLNPAWGLSFSPGITLKENVRETNDKLRNKIINNIHMYHNSKLKT